MKPDLRSIAFWFSMLLIVAVPAYIIARYQWIFQYGTVYRFKLAPVDPYDALRGRYLRLAFDASTFIYHNDTSKYPYGGYRYVILERKNGYAAINRLSKKEPSKGDYFKAKISYDEPLNENSIKNRKVVMEFPFNEYFMNENMATAVDSIYPKIVKDSSLTCYADISISHGKYLVKGVYVGNTPIEKYLSDVLKR